MDLKFNEGLDNAPQYMNIASQAVEQVIASHRNEKLGSDLQSKEVIESHLENMRALLNTYEYEIINIKKILSNTKKMKRLEAYEYLNKLEALAYGYKKLLGSEITLPLLTGIITKSSDLNTLNKYYELLIGDISKRIYLAESRSKIEERKIESLTLELKYKEAGIMRFFRKGEIERIKRRIQAKKRKVEKYSAKASNLKSLLESIKSYTKR